MSEPEAAAQCIAEALKERLKAMGVPVDDLAVALQPDGLVFQWTLMGGEFHQAKINDRDWHQGYLADEEAFIRRIAKGFPRRLPDTLWNAKGELDLHYLFLRVIRDLNRIARSQDDYDNLRVASLLRLLLLDNPLIHKVNRLHRIPVVFQVGFNLVDNVTDSKAAPRGKGPRLVLVRDGRLFQAVGDYFDPEYYDRAPQSLPWDDFLKALVVKVEDHFVTVRELVSHMAYVEGLVHFGEPKSKRPADVELQKWRRMLAVGGRGPLLATLAAIGRVVVAAALPLVEASHTALSQGITAFPEDQEGGDSE